MRPNLFQFATSELSQDAFICWLLSWADDKHESDGAQLHLVGKALLEIINQHGNITVPSDHTSVEVYKQHFNIDVFCIVNSTIVLLIEDKVGTKQHSDQLARYKAFACDELGYAVNNVIPVYIQTGDQSDFTEATKQGYLVLERKDLLTLLESDIGEAARKYSDILDDFTFHLRTIEDDVQSFLSLPPAEWSDNAWKGYYSSLQHSLGEGHWDYVSNPAGGFMGFWWYFDGNDDYQLYLQLEQGKFCFKIWVADNEKRRYFREYWYQQIVTKCPVHGIKAKRPERFGNGQYMTVALVDQAFPVLDTAGLIDMKETLVTIRSAQAVLDDCLGIASATTPVCLL